MRRIYLTFSACFRLRDPNQEYQERYLIDFMASGGFLPDTQAEKCSLNVCSRAGDHEERQMSFEREKGGGRDRTFENILELQVTTSFVQH